MEVVAMLTALAFAVNKTIGVIKRATDKDYKGVTTQVLVWIVAFVAVALASHALLTEAAIVPGIAVPLGSLDWPSQVMLGWVLGSSGSFSFDIVKALTNSDVSPEPTLLSRGSPS